LLFNALEAILVTVDTDGNVVYVKDENKEDKPLLSRLAEKVELKPVKAEYVDPDHKNYKGDVVDLLPYMYQTIVVYEKDDVVVFVKEVKSLTFAGTVTAVTTGNITIEDADEDDYTFKTSSGTAIDFMYNGEEVSDGYDYEALVKDEAQVIVVLKGESGDKIKDNLEVLAVIATQASGAIQVEDTYVKDELTLDAIYLPKDGKVVDFDNLVIKGDADSLEDIEEDDVLSVFVPLKSGNDDYFETSAANKMTIIVSRDTVEGRITRVSGSDYTIGGKVYGLNPFGVKGLEAGNEGLFYLDYEGKLFAFDEEGSGKPGNYALILDVTEGWQTTPGGVVLADPKVKLLTASGEEITYVLDIDDIVEVDDKNHGQTITVALSKGMVIEYDLDKNNVIDDLKVVTMLGSTEFKTNVNSFNLASNAVIFNLPSGAYDNTDDAAVIDEDELDDEITAKRFRNTKGEIEILVVIKGGAEVEGIFALITKGDSDGNTGWDEDEEKSVIEYTAYVDGEKVVYLKHKDAIKNETIINKGPEIYELTVSGGKLKGAVTGSAVKASGVAANSRVTSSITTVVNEEDENSPYTYFLADDVVIYVLKDDDGTLVFDKVGVKNDIRGKYFEAYDVYGDEDGDYDIVVVYPVDYPVDYPSGI
jgi:hypothetical protein